MKCIRIGTPRDGQVGTEMGRSRALILFEPELRASDGLVVSEVQYQVRPEQSISSYQFAGAGRNPLDISDPLKLIILLKREVKIPIQEAKDPLAILDKYCWIFFF